MKAVPWKEKGKEKARKDKRQGLQGDSDIPWATPGERTLERRGLGVLLSRRRHA